jgi:hypothetical protein
LGIWFIAKDQRLIPKDYLKKWVANVKSITMPLQQFEI